MVKSFRVWWTSGLCDQTPSTSPITHRDFAAGGGSLLSLIELESEVGSEDVDDATEGEGDADGGDDDGLEGGGTARGGFRTGCADCKGAESSDSPSLSSRCPVAAR
jgi:hypothetical protein